MSNLICLWVHLEANHWVCILRRWPRISRVRTALTRPCPAGQADRQRTAVFQKISAEFGQWKESRQKSVQKRDKDRTGHEQCCPPTSGLYTGTVKLYDSIKRFWSWEPMESFVGAKLIKLWAGLTKNGPL